MSDNNLGTIYSDNFKRWFGDWENDPQNASKVVDDNGMPLAVYHGTTNRGKDGKPFRIFRTESEFGEGVMFANNYNVASSFSNGGEARFVRLEDRFNEWCDKDTIEGLVEFLNKVVADSKYEFVCYGGCNYRLNEYWQGGGNTSSFLGRTEEEAYHKLVKEVKRIIERIDSNVEYGSNGGVYNVFLNIRNPYIIDACGGQFDMIKNEFTKKPASVFTIVSYVKQSGKYDGVIIKNVRETTMDNGILTNDYIVFKSNQIKHATDNNGNYDPDNDDIAENIIRKTVKEVLNEIFRRKHVI